MNAENIDMSPESVEKAVIHFYNVAQDNQLNKFLSDAQRSVSAWTHCWYLLGVDKAPEVQYYGANTLHYKISKHWHEIPDDQVPFLYERLVGLLQSHSGSVRAVIVRICVSIASFILQNAGRIGSPIVQSLTASASRFCAGDETTKRSTSWLTELEILKMIPEDFTGLCLEFSRKTLLEEKLVDFSSSVLEVIYQFLIDGVVSDELKIQAIQCLNSWLNLGISLHGPCAESLVSLLFDMMNSRVHFEHVVEALVSVFESSWTQDSRTSFSYQCLSKAAHLGVSLKFHSSEPVLTHHLTRIIVSAARSNIRTMITSLSKKDEYSNTFSDLFHALINTVTIERQYPTEEHSSYLSLSFWFDLQDLIMEESHCHSVVETVEDLLLDLTAVMVRKSKRPDDSVYNSWEEHDKENFECYRRDFGDAASYFSKFVGSRVFEKLHLMLTDCLTAVHAKNVRVEWQEFESILHMITSVVFSEDSDNVCRVFQLLPHVPCTHPSLASQIILFIGKCALVLDDKMFVESINFIVHALNYEDIVSTAATNLQDLLIANARRVSLVSDAVFEAIKLLLASNDLKPSVCETIGRCLGIVLGSVNPHGFASLLEEVMVPHANALFVVFTVEFPFSEESCLLLKQKMRLLSGLLKSFEKLRDVNQSAVVDKFNFGFLQVFLPIVKQNASNAEYRGRLMNRLFRLFDQITKTMNASLPSLVPDICELVCSFFDCDSAHYLDFVKAFFLATSNDRENPVLRRAFVSVCTNYLNVLKANDPFVSPFMIFSTEVAKKASHLLETDYNCLCRLFNAATTVLEVADQTVKTQCQFLSSFVTKATDAFLARLVQSQGAKLLQALFVCLNDRLPRNQICFVAEVISALINRQYELVRAVSTEILAGNQQVVKFKAGPEERQRFLEKLMRARDAVAVKAAVDEFAMACKCQLDAGLRNQNTMDCS